MSQEFRYVGKGVLPKGGVEVVSGKAIYADDIKLGNMLYAKVLRSPHQHARIKSIDTSKAEALPGVAATLSHKDIYKYIPHTAMLDTYLLESETLYPLDSEVYYVGEEVVAVAAATEEMAEEALDLIEVEYEPLPGVFDAEEAMKEGVPPVNSRLNTNRLGY